MFFGIFDIFPNLLTTGLTTLFPIFASYKALRTADPAQLTPWLMFWVVFTIAQTAEYWFSWAIDWIPFYAWIRFGAYLYLVQGAPYIYQMHVHPFLAQHETDIERFIGDVHANAKRVGLNYLNQAIEFVKVNVLGLPPRQPSPPPSRAGASYAQNLLSRFNLPSARDGLAAPAGDFYGLLSGALQGASQWQRSGTSRADAAEALSASGTLIPEELSRRSPNERMSYITSQRERLSTLIQAFDREANSLSIDEGSRSRDRSRDISRDRSRDRSRHREGEGLTKSKSELDFDRVEYDEALEERATRMGQRTTSGGWMPWAWGAGNAAGGRAISRSPSHEDRGRSSGNDLAY